mmetsp:Transcript_15335/g.51602  ORF Transcript_15335/g.51602 Transcript_15335/m.51602 type:complete len:246 (+) Transcript_15335:819-1556(+)
MDVLVHLVRGTVGLVHQRKHGSAAVLDVSTRPRLRRFGLRTPDGGDDRFAVEGAHGAGPRVRIVRRVFTGFAAGNDAEEERLADEQSVAGAELGGRCDEFVVLPRRRKRVGPQDVHSDDAVPEERDFDVRRLHAREADVHKRLRGAVRPGIAAEDDVSARGDGVAQPAAAHGVVGDVCEVDIRVAVRLRRRRRVPPPSLRREFLRARNAVRPRRAFGVRKLLELGDGGVVDGAKQGNVVDHGLAP